MEIGVCFKILTLKIAYKEIRRILVIVCFAKKIILLINKEIALIVPMGSNEPMDAKDATKACVLNAWEDLWWIMASACDVIYLIQNPQNINFSKIDVHSAKTEQQISVAFVAKALLILQILQI